MNLRNMLRGERSLPWSVRKLAFLLLSLSASSTAWAGGISLEGQNKGDTNNLYASNLQNWQEMDFIPCRVDFASGSAGTQTIVLTFAHINGSTPGIENLFSFTTSSNAVFTSSPVLSAPTNSGTWSYTF